MKQSEAFISGVPASRPYQPYRDCVLANKPLLPKLLADRIPDHQLARNPPVVPVLPPLASECSSSRKLQPVSEKCSSLRTQSLPRLKVLDHERVCQLSKPRGGGVLNLEERLQELREARLGPDPEPPRVANLSHANKLFCDSHARLERYTPRQLDEYYKAQAMNICRFLGATPAEGETTVQAVRKAFVQQWGSLVKLKLGGRDSVSYDDWARVLSDVGFNRAPNAIWHFFFGDVPSVVLADFQWSMSVQSLAPPKPKPKAWIAPDLKPKKQKTQNKIDKGGKPKPEKTQGRHEKAGMRKQEQADVPKHEKTKHEKTQEKTESPDSPKADKAEENRENTNKPKQEQEHSQEMSGLEASKIEDNDTGSQRPPSPASAESPEALLDASNFEGNPGTGDTNSDEVDNAAASPSPTALEAKKAYAADDEDFEESGDHADSKSHVDSKTDAGDFEEDSADQMPPEANAAALRVQSVQRGRLARRKVAQKRRDADTQKNEVITAGIDSKEPATGDDISMITSASASPEEYAAVVHIQSIHRGRKARKEMADVKESKAMATDSHGLDIAVDGNAETAVVDDVRPEEHAAAIRVQSIQRGRKARQKTARMRESGKSIFASPEEEQAAVRIQSIHRGRKARRTASEMKKSNSQEDTVAAPASARSESFSDDFEDEEFEEYSGEEDGGSNNGASDDDDDDDDDDDGKDHCGLVVGGVSHNGNDNEAEEKDDSGSIGAHGTKNSEDGGDSEAGVLAKDEGSAAGGATDVDDDDDHQHDDQDHCGLIVGGVSRDDNDKDAEDKDDGGSVGAHVNRERTDIAEDEGGASEVRALSKDEGSAASSETDDAGLPIFSDDDDHHQHAGKDHGGLVVGGVSCDANDNDAEDKDDGGSVGAHVNHERTDNAEDEGGGSEARALSKEEGSAASSETDDAGLPIFSDDDHHQHAGKDHGGLVVGGESCDANDNDAEDNDDGGSVGAHVNHDESDKAEEDGGDSEAGVLAKDEGSAASGATDDDHHHQQHARNSLLYNRNSYLYDGDDSDNDAEVKDDDRSKGAYVSYVSKDEGLEADAAEQEPGEEESESGSVDLPFEELSVAESSSDSLSYQ